MQKCKKKKKQQGNHSWCFCRQPVMEMGLNMRLEPAGD